MILPRGLGGGPSRRLSGGAYSWEESQIRKDPNETRLRFGRTLPPSVLYSGQYTYRLHSVGTRILYGFDRSQVDTTSTQTDTCFDRESGDGSCRGKTV